MSSHNSRVAARTQLAKALKSQLPRAQAEGIVEEDLDVIATSGDDAAEADREQREQLAKDDVRRKGRAADEEDALARGEKVRNRMPAVVQSLMEQGHLDDARFATALSFSRFRLRNLPPVDPALAENPAVKEVQAVEREDKATLLHGLANLVKTFLTREHIVAELARRGIDQAALTRLEADARAGWEAGKNQRRAAEATQRESDACDRQKVKWDANRHMIRAAVKGDPVLEALYAEC